MDITDYRTVLFLHINRIGTLFSESVNNMTNPGAAQKFLEFSQARAVDFLEALLSPFLDEIYENEKKNNGTVFEKFASLIRLIGRKRMLPTEEEMLEEGYIE